MAVTVLVMLTISIFFAAVSAGAYLGRVFDLIAGKAFWYSLVRPVVQSLISTAVAAVAITILIKVI